jgi:hypothetical protein
MIRSRKKLPVGFLGNVLLYHNYKLKTVDTPPQQMSRNLYTTSVGVPIPNSGKSLHLPFQFTAKHKGGQIDTNNSPLTTIFNGAIGLEYSYGVPSLNWEKKRFVYDLYTKNYIVGYHDHSFTHKFPFKNGSGIYLNAGANTRWANFMLSYWKGNGFISEFGGKLYQSVSTTVHHPEYTEKNRQLLILRIMKDWNVGNGLTFSGRLEPFYDFKAGSIEFSAGLYLNFNTDFYLAKIKRNPTE